MTQVFLDTVGLIALWNRRDQWHVDAKAAYDDLDRRQVEFATTHEVLLECGNTAARQPFRPMVGELRESLLEAGQLFEPTDEELTEAWRSYLRGDAGDAGIVDQISFAVMRRLKITEAFTNDRHFTAAGFKILF